MFIDTVKPFFKYSIKVKLIEKGIEVNDLYNHLTQHGYDLNIGTLSRYINHKYDSDKSMPSDTLKEIANFLGVTMESLYNE